MKSADDILAAISKLSDNHFLKNGPENYKQGFAEAAISAYPPNDIERILQSRFFIPDDSQFDSNRYYESASELSVQNHLRKIPSTKSLAIDKQVNPPKDVDAYYEVGTVRVSLEVKCPCERMSEPNTLIFKTAGRVPEYKEQFKRFREGIIEGDSTKEVILGKNKDMT
jgi:hypothetical protein